MHVNRGTASNWALLMSACLALGAACGSKEPTRRAGTDGAAGSGGVAGAVMVDAGGAAGSTRSERDAAATPIKDGASTSARDAPLSQEMDAAVVLPRQPPDSDHPYIQLYGRWDRSNPKKAVAGWGAVYIVAKFEGTSCKIRLTDEQTVLPMQQGTGNIYQYRIDSEPFKTLQPTSSTEYTLATNLPSGPHLLFFVRRTESRFGKTTFEGLTLDVGKTLLPPDPRPSRKIEVYGDSITAGLANENTGWYTNATQNGYDAFGPQVARLLKAEWHIEARGGGSFFNDFWLPMIPWFDKTFGPYELEHNPPSGAKLWNFAEWQPDVFILALGTNDFSDMYPHIDETTYVEKYQKFLRDLRARYPGTEIFALAPFKPGAPWDEARQYITHAVTGLGDSHVHAVDPRAKGAADEWLSMPADYVTGDEYHPNIAGHTKIAKRLAAIIGPIMKW